MKTVAEEKQMLAKSQREVSEKERKLAEERDRYQN